MRTPRIMVVQDPSATSQELIPQLRSLGYEVASAGDAARAVETGRAFRADLAVVDLPGSGGTEAADRIHEELSVPIVLMTEFGDDDESPVEQVRSSSSYGYLTRPYTRREVATIIELALHRHRMERVIVLSETRFRLLFDQNPAGVIVETVDGRILDCNAAVARMLGYDDPAELRDRPASTLFLDPLEDLERRQKLAEGYPVANEETQLRHREGHGVWAVDNAVLFPDPMTGRGQILRTLLDITERKAMEEGLERMAYRDALTGLPNRRLLEIRAEQALAEARRRSEHAALVFMDLIGFKQVNDQVGHRAGDELLVNVSRRIRASLRRTDAAARFGGDEFMVLLSGMESQEAAVVAAERMLEHLGAPFRLESGETRVQARAGVAVYPNHGRDFDALVSAADDALTRAKGMGGAVVVVAEASAPPRRGPTGPVKAPASRPRRSGNDQGTSATDAGAL